MKCAVLAIAMLYFAATTSAAEDIAFIADIDGSEQRYVQVLPAEFDVEQPVDILIYENFQDAIRQSFGGTKTDVPEQYRNRSAELWPDRFTMPSAFAVGGNDKSVPPDSVLRLANKLQRAGRDTLLIHRENGGHSTTYDDAVKILKFALERLAE